MAIKDWYKLTFQIDRDAQFKKSFLDPLQIITSVIGWETERTANLDFLFA